MLGGDGQVYGIYCGDGFTVYMYVKTHQVVDVPYVHLFVCQSHLKEKRKKLGDWAWAELSLICPLDAEMQRWAFAGLCFIVLFHQTLRRVFFYYFLKRC